MANIIQTFPKGSGGTGGGGHTIEGDGTAVTDRDTLNFKDMSVSDDSTNEKTDVKPHRLTQSELADIISPLPFFDFSNPGAEAFIFSTNERVIGQWIDGKPLYQKSYKIDNFAYSVPETAVKVADTTGLNLVNWFGTLSTSNKAVKHTFTYVSIGNDTKSTRLSYYVNTNELCFLSAETWGSSDLMFTIRYTKTTDQPVATGEKIVGQWIDGKALYEKSILVASAVVPANYDGFVDLTNDGSATGCTLISAYGSRGGTSNIPYVASTFMIQPAIHNNNFALSCYRSGNQVNLIDVRLTFRYTKT